MPCKHREKSISWSICSPLRRDLSGEKLSLAGSFKEPFSPASQRLGVCPLICRPPPFAPSGVFVAVLVAVVVVILVVAIVSTVAIVVTVVTVVALIVVVVVVLRQWSRFMVAASAAADASFMAAITVGQ